MLMVLELSCFFDVFNSSANLFVYLGVSGSFRRSFLKLVVEFCGISVSPEDPQWAFLYSLGNSSQGTNSTRKRSTARKDKRGGREGGEGGGAGAAGGGRATVSSDGSTGKENSDRNGNSSGEKVEKEGNVKLERISEV